MKLKQWILTLLLIILLPSFVLAKTYVSQDNPTSASDNFLGPTLHLNLGKVFGPVGIAGLAEYGHRQMRLNGTLGFEFGQDASNGIKFTYEYLRQKLLYNFISGSTRQWVHQSAVGAAFQHIVGSASLLKSYELATYMSKAASKHLRNQNYFSSVSQTTLVDTQRRIAGARAYGFSGMLHFLLFHRTNVGTGVNYDNYRYDTKYLPDSDKEVQGFGGTLNIMQPITQHTNVSLLTSFRASFDQYKAAFNWTPGSAKNLTLGIYGEYFDGHHQLNSFSDAGITASYFFDRGNMPKNNTKSKDSALSSAHPVGPLDHWLLSPAVYMPTVLAIADMQTTGCRTFSLTYTTSNDIITLDKTYRTMSLSILNTGSNIAAGKLLGVNFRDANGNTLATVTTASGLAPSATWNVPIPSGLDLTKARSLNFTLPVSPPLGLSLTATLTTCT